MFYQFDDEVLSVQPENLNDALITAGYVNIKELERVRKIFDFSVRDIEQCRESTGIFYSGISVYDDYSFVKLTVHDPENINTEPDCIAFFIKKSMILFVDIKDSDSSNRNLFMTALSRCSCQSITIEKLVCNFFETMILCDNRALEESEKEINALEEKVLKNQADKDFNLKLLNMKKELLELRGYYEQLIDIGDLLRENENELFSSEDLKCFKTFINKAGRLKENVDLLRSSVIHLWDAYQAYLDMRLNQTMKVFTLVTTVFFPLTVIVGWYGMNFESMPEFHWKYGYVFVIFLSVAVIGALCLWMKKKKWI